MIWTRQCSGIVLYKPYRSWFLTSSTSIMNQWPKWFKKVASRCYLSKIYYFWRVWLS